MAIVGDLAYEWASPVSPEYGSVTHARDQLIAGVLLSADGSVSVLPPFPGVVRPIHPSVGIGGDGRLHVVFGVADSANPHDPAAEPDSVMHAVWDGFRWLPLRRIRQIGNVVWDPVSPSNLISTLRGVSFAVPRNSSDSITATYVSAQTRADPTVSGVVTGGAGVAYVRLARMGGTVLMAWVGAQAIPGVTDRNALFVARSRDGARTWSHPERLEPPGHGRAYDPSFVTSANGAAYLVWAKRPESRGPLDSLAAAVSLDSGETWRLLPAMFVPTGLIALRVIQAENRPVVLFADLAGKGLHVRVLSDDGWNRPAGGDLSIKVHVPFAAALNKRTIGILRTVDVRMSGARRSERETNAATELDRIELQCR
jgi:hypothetical protein